MPAAKEKISFQLVARFMALLLLLAATAALAQARSAAENRVWQKSTPTTESLLSQPPQLLEPHQVKAPVQWYDASGYTFAAQNPTTPQAKPIDETRPQHGNVEHDATAFNQAKAWEKDPNTVETRFNQNLVDANGKEIPGFRPDAQRVQRIRITKDGKKIVDVIEVQSPGQSDKFMNDKIAAIKKALGSQAGDVRWIPRQLGAVRDLRQVK